ncbi:MAG: RDD family protein [Pseudomonadota bacterium]
MTATAANTETAPRKQERALITPEGVNLRIRLASAGERAAAFSIDVSIIAGALVVMTLLAALMGAAIGSAEFVGVVWLLMFFILRAFYFTLFELGPRAATPGKRLIGIRVAPRNGGRLRAEAIFVRNAMREIEVFLPLGFLASQGGDQVSGLIALSGFTWCAIFLFFPLFNRDRLRPGDIAAGTWVVQTPRRKLERDLAGGGERALSNFEFSTEQLDAYGVHELHVLEDVLRVRADETMAMIAERIRNKIKHVKKAGESDADFLDAYYTALRKRLETRLLYGVRRRDKFDER